MSIFDRGGKSVRYVYNIVSAATPCAEAPTAGDLLYRRTVGSPPPPPPDPHPRAPGVRSEGRVSSARSFMAPFNYESPQCFEFQFRELDRDSLTLTSFFLLLKKNGSGEYIGGSLLASFDVV